MGYTTEEEQVEALKKWWRESGTSIVAGILLAIGAIFGWQAWEKRQLEQSIAASAAFQQLGEAWEAMQDPEAPEVAETTFTHLVQVLRDEHSGSVYAHMGSLQMARHLVEKKDLAGAAEHLRWVIDHGAPDVVAEVARLRLAQVLLGQGEHDAALALLDGHEPEFLAADWQELRGDLLVYMERRDDAVDAYRQANELAANSGQRRPLLDLKLDDLAVDAEDS